jgi:hypothetical protein
MIEQVPPQPPEDVDGALDQDHEDVGQHDVHVASEEPTRTGVPAVDGVLADVDRLDGVPLDEHLAAFERAHESLRSALDADPGEPA